MDEKNIDTVGALTTDVAELKEQNLSLKAENKRISTLMVAVVIVLFLGFAAAFIAVGAMVNDYLAERHATQQSLRDSVKAQNDKVDELIRLQSKENADIDAKDQQTMDTLE